MATKDLSKDMELDHYIREFGSIIRISNSETHSAKEVLNIVFQSICSYKAMHEWKKIVNIKIIYIVF